MPNVFQVSETRKKTSWRIYKQFHKTVMFNLTKMWSFFKSPLKYMTSSWQRLNAYQKWHSIKKFVYFAGRNMQFEVFTNRPNGILPYTFCFLSIFSSGLIFYTTCHYIHMGEYAKVVPVYCMFGIVVSVCSDQFLVNSFISYTTWNVWFIDIVKYYLNY